MFIDSHCHLDRMKLDEFPNGIEDIVNRAQEARVSHMLCVCVTLQSFPSMLKAVKGFDNVSVSCGVHPLNPEDKYQFEDLLELCHNPSVVAVGETGLDYFYSPENQSYQRTCFEQHIQVARQVKKPLIIHTRDAREDTLRIMQENQAEEVGGVLHCFTESWDMAKQALDMGFFISISGIVSFRNASALRDVVKKLPLDRLLIETDSPYLAPVPHRGKQNQPAYVADVAAHIADIKNLSINDLAQVTSDNFYELFQLAKK